MNATTALLDWVFDKSFMALPFVVAGFVELYEDFFEEGKIVREAVEGVAEFDAVGTVGHEKLCYLIGLLDEGDDGSYSAENSEGFHCVLAARLESRT